MNNILDITVDISSVSSTGELEFGYPLILASKATSAVEYTKCTSLKEVVKAIVGTSAETGAEENAKKTDTYKVAELIFAQENAPSEIAIYHSTKVATDAIADIADKDWRQLVCILGEGDETTVAAISDAIEALDYKMFFVTIDKATVITDKVKENKRTVAFYHDGVDATGKATDPYAVAAWVGETAGRTVGSFTYKNLILKVP